MNDVTPEKLAEKASKGDEECCSRSEEYRGAYCPFFHKMKAKNEKYANYELKNLTFQHYGNKIYI